MRVPIVVSRRGLIKRALTGFAALIGADAGALGASPDDRGIGGTGATPAEWPGEDRGIGGTGVVGTIRRFGSIVVNDLRIGYPPAVAVTIDGNAATAADLRLGQVVAVLAARRGGRLSTRHIAVMHEVVGPIEMIGPHRLSILGQIVDVAAAAGAWPWDNGEIVAVSGLRRPDGVIVASLVEPGDPAALRVTGLVQADGTGTARIGGLALAGSVEPLLDRRVSLGGSFVGGRFEIGSVAAPAAILMSRHPGRLSIEAYVVRHRNRLSLASGLDITGTEQALALPEGQTVRAVVTASVGTDGHLRATSVRAASAPHGRADGRSHRGPEVNRAGRRGGRSGARGDADGPGQESGPSTGRADPRSGPAAGGWGHGGPSGGPPGRGAGRR